MSILTKALKITTNGGDNLTAEDLAPAIYEYLGKVSPLFSMLPKVQANGITHSFMRRTAIPRAEFAGELTEPNFQASTYARQSADLKIMRISGGVSGFQQAVSEEFVNALDSEITGSLEGLAETLEWSVLYANAADVKQFNGIEAYVQNSAVANKSTAAGGSVLDVDGVITLSHLDSMLDAVSGYRMARSDQYAWLATPEMISKVSGLQTRINREVQSSDYEGGFRLATYRGVPIIQTGYLSPAATTTSPTVAATVGAGGSLAAGTYHYAISSITIAGEQLVGTSDSDVSATTNNTIALAWTADPNALLYKVWRGTSAAADDLQLLTTIPALTYDGTGAVSGMVASYSDTGTITPTAAIHPLTTGEQSIWLINLNAERGYNLTGMLSPLGEKTREFFKFIPLATRKSALEYMIEGFLAGYTAYPELNLVARRVKMA
jgi:hypothetical protein